MTTDCECPRIFTAIRRVLVPALGVSRRDVRPSFALDGILAGDRCRVWKAIEEVIGSRLPGLRPRVGPVLDSVWGLSALLGTLLVVLAAAWLLPIELALLVILTAVIVIPLTGATDGFRRRLAIHWDLPLECATVGDLVHVIAYGRQRHRGAAFYRRHPEAIYPAVRAIISEQLNVPLEDIKPETRFIEDLHAD